MHAVILICWGLRYEFNVHADTFGECYLQLVIIKLVKSVMSVCFTISDFIMLPQVVFKCAASKIKMLMLCQTQVYYIMLNVTFHSIFWSGLAVVGFLLLNLSLLWLDPMQLLGINDSLNRLLKRYA